jgi:hypothetical protein
VGYNAAFCVRTWIRQDAAEGKVPMLVRVAMCNAMLNTEFGVGHFGWGIPAAWQVPITRHIVMIQKSDPFHKTGMARDLQQFG